MSQKKLPYINILQSAMCIPPSDEQPLALDLKILPDKNIPPEPFFGVWLVDISGSMAGERLQNAKNRLKNKLKTYQMAQSSIWYLLKQMYTKS